MIQVCDLSFANSSITDTLGNYSLVSSGTVTISSHTYPANTDPILYVTDSSYSCIEFGQTATYSNGAIIQAGIPDYGSENWAVEFRARVPSVPPGDTGPYVLFFGCEAPYDDNGTTWTGGYWAISIDASLDTPDKLRFFYDFNNEDLTIKDNLDFTAWHLYKVTKTAEDILTLHIDGVLVATIDIEQHKGFKSRATLGSFALLGVVDEFPTANHLQTTQLARLADVKVYADPMGHAEKAISLDNLSRVFRNYNTWLGAQLSGQIGDGTLTIQRNGTNVATFTANQSTAATANITVPTAVSELTNDSGYLTSSSNLDASKLTSGTVDIERLPQGALERLVKVANEAARYALTTADVQLGDTVQQLDTGIMYVVTDTDHLDSAAGYTEYTAGTAASVPWSGVTGKPTFAAVATSGAYSDLTGTPALAAVATSGAYSDLTGKPTFAAVATSGAYSDLTGTPTIPTVNNATLTIQKNGTNVQTFTANQSTNATANITVPTKTSDLTNDSGFITEDNTKIPLAGSNQISGSLIPATDNSYDLGSNSYSFNHTFTRYLQGNSAKELALFSSSNTFDPWNRGACISLFTNDYPGDSTRIGTFSIRAQGSESNRCSLIGTPSGTLTWNGQSIQTTSDQRFKQQIAEIDDKLLDAWEDVDLVQFKYNDAVDQKGKDKARLHTGYVVQQIDNACKSHGVDISQYGLYCHEEYPEETEEVEVERKDGAKVKEKKVIREASEHYSLRYTEALIVECKYLRRCIERLTARIEQLEKEREAGK